jgi:amino acid transporter
MRARPTNTVCQLSAIASSVIGTVLLFEALVPRLSPPDDLYADGLISAVVFVAMIGASMIFGFIGMRAKERPFQLMGLAGVLIPCILTGLILVLR